MTSEATPPPSDAQNLAFQALPVPVGERLVLVDFRHGQERHYRSFLIGFVENDYLIVRTPTESGFAVPLRNGDRLKVRLLAGTHVVEFETVVLRQFHAPISYWHLEYPATVKTKTLRAAPRAKTDLPAQIQSTGAAAAVEARIVDLSSRGAQVVTTQPLDETSGAVQLDFEIPRGRSGDKLRISTSATIKVIKPKAADDNGGGQLRFGVQFDALGEQEELLLENFVLQQLNKQLSGG